MATQDWQLKSIFDHFVCDVCGKENTPDWLLDEVYRTQRIRRLNDLLRRGQADQATILLTAGVQAAGDDFATSAVKAMSEFDDFSEDNDPHHEHDFGAFEIGQEKLFFKIDYFDPALERHSDDAADPNVTHRVLTIMLASEY
ncbi:DUF3768 domain-containing protein [Primorskyibacter sp. 2E233]|uniref:DUF3768 domain-containing protein n=1 Tax=Primorskyibacter sp. 2E233 TaxID=3413431 RepID=UPI003BF2141B